MQSAQSLASLLRPKTLDQYVGQQHLLGTNAPLRSLLESQQLCSMIFWGSPGCGKTSLVHVIEHQWKTPIIHMSAISSGVKDIKSLDSHEQSLFSQQKVVFVDEIHRFNKAQQDAFLPLVENGQVCLIGATTENPSFSINRALLSRIQVFRLKPLAKDDLHKLITRAIEQINQQTNTATLNITDDSKQILVDMCAGDARKLLNVLELASVLARSESAEEITSEHIQNAHGEKALNIDKHGNMYYDLLSAFHKSVRGSDVDASLFYFARMLMASDDITPIARRLLAIASEDIGNADPKALTLCLDAWDVYHRVGVAEGERAVAQAVIYCALAPKSNAVYTAFKTAKKLAEQYASAPVPSHLSNREEEKRQTDSEYQYAHNYPHAFAAEQEFLPSEVTERDFYQPQDRGFEKQLSQKVAFLQQLREQAKQHD